VIETVAQLNKNRFAFSQAGVDPPEDVGDGRLGVKLGPLKFDEHAVRGGLLGEMPYERVPAPGFHAVDQRFGERLLSIQIGCAPLQQALRLSLCQRIMVMEAKPEGIDGGIDSAKAIEIALTIKFDIVSSGQLDDLVSGWGWCEGRTASATCPHHARSTRSAGAAHRDRQRCTAQSL